MSIEQKYILGYRGLAIHFEKAADGSDSVALLPITEASFEHSGTGLMLFDNEQQASGHKDKLCTIAAHLESPISTRQEYIPLSLQTCCDLKVMPLPEFAIA